MKAFSNDPAKKQFYVDRMETHIEADELVQGEEWKNGKGCFISCTLHEYSHTKFEQAGLGPKWLGHLADKIFEGLDSKDAKQFARQFYPAIPVGANLDNIKKPFLCFMQEKNLETLDQLEFDKDKDPDVFAVIERCKNAIRDVLHAHKNQSGYEMQKAAESAARSAAQSAAESIAESIDWAAAESATWSAAQSAAESATWSADWAAAESAAWAAWSAAESAARSAAWAVWITESAARSAAWAARIAESAARSAAWAVAKSDDWAAAWAAAKSATYKEFADKLIDLLKNCEGEQ